MTRRELCSLLPAAFLLDPWAADDRPLTSAVYPYDKLPVRTTAEAEFRHILRGKTATGESIEMHETTLAPGAAPHPAHHHQHSEFWLVREGTLEVTINGRAYRFGAGSIAFVTSNDEHGIRNAGDRPATYFVVAIGPGA